LKIVYYKIILPVALLLVFTACSFEQQPANPMPDEDEQKQIRETVEVTPSPIFVPQPDEDEDEYQNNYQDNSTSSDPVSPVQSKYIIAIDAGHQRRGNYETEDIGPGTTETKPKTSSGTMGAVTKVPEYEFTLAISLLLKEELISRSYGVFMIRETHDVDISNRTRAEMATEAGAYIFVRIHANGSTNSSDNGMLTISPTSNTPFIPNLYTQSRALSQYILDEMVALTGAKDMGVWETDTMSGINWATMPVTIVEMGYMSNPEEDRLMQTPEYQQKIVEGIANGIDLFFFHDFGN